MISTHQQVSRFQTRAFTLLESLLVLLISSLLVIIFLSNFARTVHQVRARLFLAQFEEAYTSTQKESSYALKANNLMITTNEIRYLNRVIQVPKEVEFEKDMIIKFSQNGGNSSVQKIIVRLPYEDREIKYQLMIGSGRYKKTNS